MLSDNGNRGALDAHVDYTGGSIDGCDEYLGDSTVHIGIGAFFVF